MNTFQVLFGDPRNRNLKEKLFSSKKRHLQTVTLTLGEALLQFHKGTKNDTKILKNITTVEGQRVQKQVAPGS